MANKGFGIRELTLIDSGGIPTISVPQNLDINAVVVGISTGITVGGATTLSGTLNVSGTADFSGRINAVELNSQVYFQESDDSNKICNVPFMTEQQGGNTFAWLEVDNSVLTFNPYTNLLTSGYFAGNGVGLSGIVTSLVAGNGINISNTTGQVTITSTSGGIGTQGSINTSGIITASSFVGNGEGLTGVTASGTGIIVSDGGSLVGTAGTIDFGDNLSVSPISAGIVTVAFSSDKFSIGHFGIGIGTDSPDAPLDARGGGTLPAQFVTTTGSNSAGATIRLRKSHSNLAVNAKIGAVQFAGDDGTDVYISEIAKIEATINDTTYQAEDGTLKFYTSTNGSSTEKISIGPNGEIGLSGANYGTPGQVLSSGGPSAGVTWTDAGTIAGINTSGTTELNNLTVAGASTLSGQVSAGNLSVAGIVTSTLGFEATSTIGNGSDRGYTTKYYITSSGSSGYNFAGPGALNSTTNPTLYFHRGFTYILENSTGSGHPFALRVSSGGSNYSPGANFLTGSQNGTQILTVPFDAPNSIVYQCTIHGGMVGTINFPT